MDVKEMAALGGHAAAKKLGKKGRKLRSSKAGKAVQAKITTAERSRRAKLAWVTKRKNSRKVS